MIGPSLVGFPLYAKRFDAPAPRLEPGHQHSVRRPWKEVHDVSRTMPTGRRRLERNPDP